MIWVWPPEMTRDNKGKDGAIDDTSVLDSVDLSESNPAGRDSDPVQPENNPFTDVSPAASTLTLLLLL